MLGVLAKAAQLVSEAAGPWMAFVCLASQKSKAGGKPLSICCGESEDRTSVFHPSS